MIFLRYIFAPGGRLGVSLCCHFSVKNQNWTPWATTKKTWKLDPSMGRGPDHLLKKCQCL